MTGAKNMADSGTRAENAADGRLLSVIVPMYNARHTIRRCLDSLLLAKAQMRFLEVLVVDDGSTDGGAEYVKAYTDRYPDSFRLLTKQNGGHGSAVNAGVSCCAGRYFKVLDADDWVNTESLEKVLYLLKNTQAQVVVCGYDRYEEQTGKRSAAACFNGGQNRCMPEKKRLNKTMDGSMDFSMDFFMEYSVKYSVEFSMEQLIRSWGQLSRLFCLHGLIYRTDFYRQLSYRQPEHVSYDDAFFFTVPCSHADRLCAADIQLYVYRTGNPSQSVSGRNREKRIHQMETVIRSVVKTKNRNKEKTKAGKEYWYRKLVSAVTDYYVTAFLRFRNKKQGRKTARKFTKELAGMDRELFRRIKSRYCLFLAMSLCKRNEGDFEKLAELKKYITAHILKKGMVKKSMESCARGGTGI